MKDCGSTMACLRCTIGNNKCAQATVPTPRGPITVTSRTAVPIASSVGNPKIGFKRGKSQRGSEAENPARGFLSLSLISDAKSRRGARQRSGSDKPFSRLGQKLAKKERKPLSRNQSRRDCNEDPAKAGEKGDGAGTVWERSSRALFID